jgi:endogenous inhibitor of DNA gyrase (YacG/DUF329 family)
MPNRRISPPKTVACPTCNKQVAESEKAFPFCSDRCRTLDLGRWLDGSYKVSRPIEQNDLEEEV